MKKLSYLFAVVLIAGALVARPAHAETSYADISALLKSLIAQVQELQRQLAIMQEEDGVDIDTYETTTPTDRTSVPVIKVIQAKAAEAGEVYAGETAYIYGSGLSGKLDVLFDCCKPRTSASGWGSSDGYAEFVVPKDEKDGARVAITVSNGVSASEPYYVTIINSDDTDTRKGYLKIDSPDGGEKLKAGKTFRISWSWKSVVEDESMELRVKSDSCSIKDGLITSGIKNDGVYDWEVPKDLISEKCDYKVYLMVANVKSPYWDYDESDRSFQIVR
ncbi:MAG: hypothetical protein RLY47_151 [Candidatus Parcubacteria bacterium]|jgi:hypothetical protein